MNYPLLGAIVHQHCSEGYDKYLETNILQPLGMPHTTNVYLERPEDDRSQLYHVGRRGEQLLSQGVDCLDSVLTRDIPDFMAGTAIPIHDFNLLSSYCAGQEDDRLDTFFPLHDIPENTTGLSDSVHRKYRAQQVVSETMICFNRATMPNFARGMASTVNDLIKYCIGLNMAADKSRDPAPDDRGCKRAFPDMDLLLSPLQGMDGASNDDKITNTCSYAAGWATCTLPGRIEGLGINSKLTSMPILGLNQTKASKVH